MGGMNEVRCSFSIPHPIWGARGNGNVMGIEF